MRIALATCAKLPEWEVDDRPFHEALASKGASVEHLAWTADVDWSAFDAVVVRTTWDYQNRLREYLAWIDGVAAVTKLFNPAPVLRWNLDKRYLRELEAAGQRLAPTAWIDQDRSCDLSALVRERGWARGFLKPVVGANADGTFRFSEEPEELARAQAHLDEHVQRGGMMVQPYLASVETFGEVSAIFFDGEYSHGVRKIPVRGDYRVQDDHGASDEPWTPDAEDRQAMEAALAAVHERFAEHAPLLYARADFLRDDEGRLCLNELELVEPSLFFRHDPNAGERFADRVITRV